MPKFIRSVSRLAAACGIATIIIAASAAAATPRGTLSAAEYKQLSAGMTALNKSVGAKAVDWTKARAACRAVGGATNLLRTQRASCLDTVSVLGSLANFPREQRTCSADTKTTTGTTTTATSTTQTTSAGSTTTPADSALIELMACMSPRYQALSRYARALEAGAIAARRAAMARGFAGPCLAALAPSAADLKRAKLFAAATGRLAADVILLIRVTERKAPPGGFHQATVDNDVKQFENTATAVLDEHGQPKLSVCPHQ